MLLPGFDTPSKSRLTRRLVHVAGRFLEPQIKFKTKAKAQSENLQTKSSRHFP